MGLVAQPAMNEQDEQAPRQTVNEAATIGRSTGGKTRINEAALVPVISRLVIMGYFFKSKIGC